MTDTMHVVIGTAGHVDHGKTSLVRALTGIDCDRLPEEKARGISIELGFARWDLGDGVQASVIDVPGHERFVRAMAAGAAGVDVAMLVVAADDGVMPQTREHLAICELLGVRAGLVAITKADAVDAELLALVRDDVASLVKGTIFEQAAVIACSSVTRQGLDALRDAARDAARLAPPRPVDGPFFLPIDRVFSVAGFGVVATGTLLRGVIRVGDAVDALPSPRGGVIEGLRVRGLHVHDAPVGEASAARRVAVNLRGDGVELVQRGCVLASPGWLLPTTAALAEVRLLGGAAVEGRAPMSLHLGASQVAVQAMVLGAAPLAPGQRGLLRLTSDAPFAAFAGQRLVLRRAGAEGLSTVGGGQIVDPAPRLFRGAARLAAEAPFFRAASPRERVFGLVREGRARGVPLPEVIRRSLPEDRPEDALDELLKKGRIAASTGQPPVYVELSHVQEAEKKIVDELMKFHTERPLLAGAQPGELLSRLPALLAPWGPAALRRLASRRRVVEQDGLVREASHDPGVGQALGKLLALYEAAGLTPPGDDEAQKTAGLRPEGFRDAVAELRRRGQLRASGGVYFATSAVEALKGKLRAYFEASAELSAPAFKELAGGISRKFAIPLLELLDAESFTRRKGDARVAGPGARA